jgi:hypothetical protein
VQRDGREVPDTYVTTIDYPSGHSILIGGSMANDTTIPEVIRGTRASIHLGRDSEDDPWEEKAVVRAQDPFREDFKKAAGQEEVRLEPVKKDDMMSDLIHCMRDRSRLPNCDALLGYKTMVAIKLGVDAYRQSRAMLFDPEKEAVVKA